MTVEPFFLNQIDAFDGAQMLKQRRNIVDGDVARQSGYKDRLRRIIDGRRRRRRVLRVSFCGDDKPP